MIKVRSLHKQFGVVRAVNDLSFSVKKGEVLGLLGPNGAGKTTTMKIITGFMPATSGEVEVCGYDIRSHPREAKRHIGYVPEGGPLYGEMTPAALLDFVASIRHMSGAARRRRIKTVVDALELQPVMLRRIDTLSKGFKRRVALAQAVLVDPEVLILDEPTDGLDPNQKHQVRNLIRSISDEKGIIISTHLLDEVDAVCDRAIIIDQGRIVLQGTPHELHARAAERGAVYIRVRASEGLRAVALIREKAQASCMVEEENEETWLIRAAGAGTVPSLAQIGTILVRSDIELLELRNEGGSLEEVFRRVTASRAEPATVSP